MATQWPKLTWKEKARAALDRGLELGKIKKWQGIYRYSVPNGKSKGKYLSSYSKNSGWTLPKFCVPFGFQPKLPGFLAKC